MVESKFITKLPEHKSDTNYFGLDNTAERALLRYCDKFYELLKETELESTSGVMLLPGELGHSALRGQEGKNPYHSENRTVLETCIKTHLAFNQKSNSVVLKAESCESSMFYSPQTQPRALLPLLLQILRIQNHFTILSSECLSHLLTLLCKYVSKKS